MKSRMFKLGRLVFVSSLVCVLAGVLAASSLAAAPKLGAKLRIYASTPTFMAHGETFESYVYVENIGDEATTGKTLFSVTFGPGLVFGGEVISRGSGASQAFEPCEISGTTGRCSLPNTLAPGELWQIDVPIVVEAQAGTVTEQLSARGGGTVGAVDAERAITVGSPGPFGFSDAAAELLNPDDSEAVQAGSVPADFTTTLNFRSYTPKALGLLPILASVEHFKDVTAHLPVGLIGNPTVVPQCTPGQLGSQYSPNGEVHVPTITDCPFDSQIGTAQVSLGTGYSYMVSLYNMSAPPGAATELGFNVLSVIVLLDAYVRPGDSGIDVVSRDTSTTLPVTGVKITVWGVPADHSHDIYRGECLSENGEGPSGGVCGTFAPRRVFLRLPTSCSGNPLQFGASSNSYEHPDAFAEASFVSGALGGCERVPFAPQISVSPTGTAASSPTGVSVRVALPQNSNPDGLGEADLKKAVVTLPEGMAINPSAADGLQACSDAQLRVGESGPAECPEASKVGTVLLHTPLLAEPIEGNIYILSQESSDPESGSMYRIAIELRNDQRGIDIKVPGAISANRVTGRLTTTFDDNPQLPFSDITLSFKAGARAPLVTPATCQTQTTEADLYSWAQPDVAVHRSSSFSLTSGAGGGACPPPSPFAPVFSAGVSSVQAGGFTNFLTTVSRSDSDQSMKQVVVKLPLGLSGSLSSVALCGDAQANAGSCGADSQIGTVTAGAGAGPTPFYVTGGRVYITGPYKGAPFGLSIVVPAKAGPFDLGTVVVRAKVDVNALTAQLTVSTDPLPQVIGGVPVNLRLVNVTIDRHNFTFNRTSCNPTSVSGSITGGEGAVASVANRFQVTNCGALAFKPKLSASTSGKTSRAGGASLTVKLAYPPGQVTQANIAKVKVDLPKQLPSRLTTLQKACTAAQFNSNPAGCPTASIVGHAKASTPVLPVPLEGPAYFVSHGGEAFPTLVVVLQGYGVTVDLEGSTFISKSGITSSTFKAVPDVPVGSFALTLPQGKYSALAANGNLCKSKLTMPTAFVGQNGAEIHQTTKITTTGCPKTKKATRHKKKKSTKHKNRH